MKKFIALAAVALMAISCGDDDNNSTEASLNGTWKLTAFDMAEPFDLNEDGTASTSLIAESGCYNNSNLMFSGNNTVALSMESLDIMMDLVTGSEDSYEITFDCVEPETEGGTYSVSGNNVNVTFTYTDEDGTDSETVTFVRSGNTLTVEIPEMVDVPVEENGDITYSFIGATLVFTKQ